VIQKRSHLVVVKDREQSQVMRRVRTLRSMVSWKRSVLLQTVSLLSRTQPTGRSRMWRGRRATLGELLRISSPVRFRM